jgi:choline dehydrogenase-like flavoprotein
LFEETGEVPMSQKTYDVAIIGAGASGATLAHELTRRGKQVAVLEAGNRFKKLGEFGAAMKWYDRSPLLSRPLRSKEGVIIWRVFVDGGGTIVSCANGVRCLEKEFSEFGVLLEEEFLEVERELGVSPVREGLLSEGSKRIRTAAETIGVRMELMPKFIDADTCTGCGLCTYGCKYGAKWSAIRYLDKAVENGAEILHNFHVRNIGIEDGTAYGVKGVGPHGAVEIRADKIIVAAGGIGTPLILQQSGIRSAGKKLFLDLFVTTYGVTDGCNLADGPPMTLVNRDFHRDRGFILSPYINQSRLARLVECGPRGFPPDKRNLVGIMTKIRDEEIGQVFPDGSISKGVTESDWEKLREGISLSKQIFNAMEIREKNIFVSRVQGAHPGGTAAIGEVVDRNLETETKNLYVCDASVLPRSPGLPPILTLVALAKHLGNHLCR